MQVIVNGQETELISVHDRGFTYGDGVFETCLCVSGQIPLWQYHQERLTASCHRLNIPAPDGELLFSQIKQALSTDIQQIVKIIITRGLGERGYAYDATSKPSTVIIISDRIFKPAHFWQQGVRVLRCKTPLAVQPALAGLKHLNRLEQILARNEWHTDDYQEGMMCRDDGMVIEATSHNLFAVKDGNLYTPDLSACGVDGIMRRYVIELAGKSGMSLYSQDIRYDELFNMDELFLTNSVTGIWPVRQLESKTWPVGEISRQFQTQIARLIPYQ